MTFVRPAVPPLISRKGLVALVHGETCLRYGELHTHACRRAAELRAAGLRPGQVVLVPEAPLLDLAVMQHALAHVGCVLLPVAAPADNAREDALIELCGAEWRWVPGAGGGELRALHRGGPVATHPALVIGTSGSSGTPKGVMLSRGNVAASSRLSNRHLRLGVGDLWLSCLPRYHVGGLLIGERCALAGAAVVLHERFDAAAVARDLLQLAVTHISLVPPMLAELLALGEPPPKSLRVVLVGGQALSGALARKAIEAGWPLHVTYGMTETCSQVASSHVLTAAPHSGAVGPLLHGVEADCGACTEPPRRIRLRGPVVMMGYVNPERAAGEGLENGWFTTGDLGCMTPDGDLCVLGRADELLVIGGEQVFPAQVEERLAAAPGVAQAAVVGLEDPVWGHRLVAAYVGEVSPAALERWCREHLPSRQRPRGFRRLEQLPVLASGKQDRRRLREMLRSDAGDQAVGTAELRA